MSIISRWFIILFQFQNGCSSSYLNLFFFVDFWVPLVTQREGWLALEKCILIVSVFNTKKKKQKPERLAIRLNSPAVKKSQSNNLIIIYIYFLTGNGRTHVLWIHSNHVVHHKCLPYHINHSNTAANYYIEVTVRLYKTYTSGYTYWQLIFLFGNVLTYCCAVAK